MDPKLPLAGRPCCSATSRVSPPTVTGAPDTITGITISAGGITFHLNTSGRSMLARVASAYTCPLPAGTPHRPIGDEAWTQDATGPVPACERRAPGHLTLVRNARFTAPVLGPRAIADRIDVRLGLGATAAIAAVAAGQRGRGARRPSRSLPTVAGRRRVPGRRPAETSSYLRIDAGWPPFDLQGVRRRYRWRSTGGRSLRPSARALRSEPTRCCPPRCRAHAQPRLGALRPDPVLARRLYLRAIDEGGEKGPFDVTLRACRRPVRGAGRSPVGRARRRARPDVRIVHGGERPLELGWLHPGYADPAAIVEPIVAPDGLAQTGAPSAGRGRLRHSSA